MMLLLQAQVDPRLGLFKPVTAEIGQSCNHTNTTHAQLQVAICKTHLQFNNYVNSLDTICTSEIECATWAF